MLGNQGGIENDAPDDIRGGETPPQIGILEARSQEESQQASLLIDKELEIGSLKIEITKLEKEIEDPKAQIETLQAQVAAK